MQVNSNYTLLIGKIDTFIRRYYLNKLLRGTIFFGAVLFAGFVAIAFSEYLGHFSTLLRTLLFFGYILLVGLVFFWLVLPPLLAYFNLGNTITHDEAAEIIGTHFTNVQDKLLNTLQLKKLSDENPEHRSLIEASIGQKIESLRPVSFPSAIRIKENIKYLKWALAPLCIIIILAFTAPSVLKDGTERLIKHNQYFAPKSPFQFVITNANLSAIQGADFKLDIKLTGDQFPNDVYLETGNNTFKLDKENISRFHYLFNNLQQNIHFQLSGNDFSSKDYVVTVNPKPSLVHFDAALNYPAYLHKKNELVTNAGDLTIPTGTTVKWLLHTQNTTEVSFILDGKTHHLQADGDIFSFSDRIVKAGIYALKAGNKFIEQGDSASYKLNVIADQPPVINVEEKADSVSSKAVYFNGNIEDDHGFSSLVFHYDIASHNGEKPVSVTKPVKADLNVTQTGFFYFWNIKELGAKPGDEVSYFFEVSDNDAVNGPKKARTVLRTLKVPTEKEINAQLENGTQQIKQKMVSAIKLSSEVERDAKKLNELLLNKNSLSFEEKKQIQELLQKREELNNLIKEIQKQNKQNELNRQENKQQDQQILEKEKQIQDLFNNVLDDKTKEMLKNLQQMLDKNEKDPAQDEVSKMQTDSKSLKKELDRVLELYKKLEFDQKLNENIDRLNKLAEKMEKLSQESKQPKADQQALQQKQDKAKSEFDDIKKSLEDLKEKNEQLEQKTNFEEPKQEEQKIDQQLDKSNEDLNKKNNQKAAQEQQQSAKQMQQMAQKMQQMEQQEEESANEVNIQQLRELIKNLVNSSFEQEKTMQALKGMYSSDPGYIGMAQKQKDIRDNMKNVEDSLYSLSKRIPQIASTVNTEVSTINTNIDKALENLGDRRTAEANRNQQYSMTAMNNLALMLTEALNQVQNSMKNAKPGQGKKKQPSLSQLGKMQKQLNQNMQKMREQMAKDGNPSPGEGKKPGEGQGQGKDGQNKGQGQGQEGYSEQLAKMARQQQMIRQALQEINRQENKDGRNGLGNLDNISKDMEQTEKDLVNRRILDETIKRQQQIQTRLLEAEKADQEREQDQQRESKAGKDIPPGYVKALENYQLMKNKQTEQLRTVPPALNFYYKSKIKLYFDQLNGK